MLWIADPKGIHTLGNDNPLCLLWAGVPQRSFFRQAGKLSRDDDDQFMQHTPLCFR